MKTRSCARWLLVPLLFLSLEFSQAGGLPPEPPLGTFDFAVGNDAPIFDITGDYGIVLLLNEGTAEQVEVGIGVSIQQDAKGRLSGSGITAVLIGNDFVAGEYRLNGQVRTAPNGDTVTSFVIRVRGEGFIGGQFRSYRLAINVSKAYVDQVTGTIYSSLKQVTVAGSVNGMGSISGKADLVTDLPASMDGSWTLSLNIVPLSKLSGVGVITLSNGRQFTLNLGGKYFPGAGSDIRLTGVGETRGAAMNIFLPEDLNSVSVENSRVVGQFIFIAVGVP